MAGDTPVKVNPCEISAAFEALAQGISGSLKKMSLGTPPILSTPQAVDLEIAFQAVSMSGWKLFIFEKSSESQMQIRLATRILPPPQA
jgi:hypothetical protein